MTNGDDASGPEVTASGLTRRDLLRIFGVTGAAAAAWPILEACGSGSGSTGTGQRLSATQLKDILKYAAVTDTSHMGAGTTWKLGATLPYTGNGSFFSGMWSTGIDLAVEHIKAIGGPNIDFVKVDNGSGDAQKSHQGVDQLVSANVAGILGTEALGGVWGPLKQNKILCLDAGAGAPVGIQGIPYYYGSRSAYFSDQWVGTLEYMKAKMSSKKRVVTVGNVSPLVDFASFTKPLLSQYGFDEVKSINATGGATDFTAVLAQIRDANPDIVWPWISQYDIGYFMKQYATAGLKAPVFAFQWTRAARQIAGNGYNGVYFSTEYLDWGKPQNPWQKLYIDDYKAKYGYFPEAYTADFYMTVFMWWQLMRDVQAKGGNINNGDDLLAALNANPNFPTVFGGTSSAPGTLTIDLKTHSPSTLPQAVFQDHNQTLTALATYNVGGNDFKLSS